MDLQLAAGRKSMLGAYSDYLSQSASFVDVSPDGAFGGVKVEPWGVIAADPYLYTYFLNQLELAAFNKMCMFQTHRFSIHHSMDIALPYDVPSFRLILTRKLFFLRSP